MDSIANTSQLSASAPEFVPAGMSQYEVSADFLPHCRRSNSNPFFFFQSQKRYYGIPFSSILSLISAQDQAFYNNSDNYYGEPTLAHIVSDVLGHLSSSPGSFETDIEDITAMLNSWVTTKESLEELVELIFTQVCCQIQLKKQFLKAITINDFVSDAL